MSKSTMYLNGCSGVESPVDINGNEISEGDLLTWDYGDNKKVEGWMLKPVFKVEKHMSGGLCAKGIDKPLFLHDFRFKYCKLINN